MKKNIWILNHYATSMYRNKGGRHYWFAENLLKRGYKPTIFCANTYHNKTEHVDTAGKKYATDTVNNIPFVFVKTTQALGNGMDRVRNMFLFYRNLFPVAKEYAKLHGKPDVILASSPHPLTMVAGIQFAKKLNIPCICEVRDLWPEAIFAFGKTKESSLLGKLLIKGEHWIYKNADALIFLKEGDTDYLKEREWTTDQGGQIDLEKCHYINNGVDIQEFNNLVNRNVLNDQDLSGDKFNVVYTGAIRPVNNVGNILDAAKLLIDYDNIQFLIYGEGSELEKLKERVRKENLTNVKLKGYIDKKYIPYVLSRSSVNLLNYSSTKYNWSRGNSSNKLFEYMASGKPIISTVKMGYDPLKKYKCGFSLEKHTPKELANTIMNLYNLPKNLYEEIGENSKKAANDFDYNILTKKLVSVIDNLGK